MSRSKELSKLKEHAWKPVFFVKHNHLNQQQNLSIQRKNSVSKQSLCGHSPLTPATSAGPNPRHTGSHLTGSLVGHFPSADQTSNAAAQISTKPQTVTRAFASQQLSHKVPLAPNRDDSACVQICVPDH